MKTANPPPTEIPAAWFVELERARATNDFARAANAQRQLERLGVRVRYLKLRAAVREAAPVPAQPTPPPIAGRPKQRGESPGSAGQ